LKNNIKLVFLIFFITSILFSSALLVTAQETIKIKFAMQNPLEPILSHESAFARVFKNTIETKTNNRIQVELYPSFTLGKSEEQWQMVKRGTIQMAWIEIGTLSRFYPLANIQSVFYLFPNQIVGEKVYHGDFGREMKQDIFKKTGIRVVAIPLLGYSVLINNVRQVHSPEDLKGLRIRSMAIPIQLKSFEALGAKSLTIAWGEMYSSLQTGVVDGMHGAHSGFMAAKTYEVVDYLTFTNHFLQANYVIANDEWIKSLSESDRTIFWDAVGIAEIASVGATKIALATEDRGISGLIKRGLKVYAPSEEEMEEFRELAIPAGEKVIEETLGKEGIRWLNKLRNAIKIAEEEVKEGNLW